MIWVIPISGMRSQRFMSVGNLETLVLWVRILVSQLGELCYWTRGWDDWVRKRPRPRNSPQSVFTMPTSRWEWDALQFMDAGLGCWWCRWRVRACVRVCVCQVLIQTRASLLCKPSICKTKTLQKPTIFQILFSVKSDPRKKSKVDCRINSNICYVPSKILNTVYWWTYVSQWPMCPYHR